MPRGRGGQRQGVIGKAYANRSDLNGANVVAPKPLDPNNGKMPITAVPGQQYGAATAQKAAQQAVPMAGSPSPVTPTPAGQSAPQANPLANVTPLAQPTTHGLPITTGLPTGPGAGPEVMPQTIQTNPASSALTLLNSLGENVSPQVNYIRNYLALQAENQMPH
jgi:hypothetical protein